MDNIRTKESILFGKYFSSVLVICLVSSIALFLFSQSLPTPWNTICREISMILFGAILVTYLHHKVLEGYFQHKSCETINLAITPHMAEIESTILGALNNIAPDIKKESVQSIHDIQRRVSEATEFLLNGIGVLSGAKVAGIVNIFPNRYLKVAGEQAVDVIAQDLLSENTEIRIMGISLGDYFLDRGVHHTLFAKILENSSTKAKGPKFKALIVHPQSKTLKERARWEVGPDFYQEPTFFDSTTFIETDGSARIAKRLCEKHNSILSVRLYEQAPTAFVLLTSRFVFFEPYHYAARGSNVPLFQVHANADLYKYYSSHFDRIWDVSQSVTEFIPFGKKTNGN